ncbi:MAG: hypothetical protein ACR2NR_07935 [Solirubrobacteraceae bacterium]
MLKIVEAVNLQKAEWPQHECMAGKVWENARALAVDKRRPQQWFVARPGCANKTYVCVPLGGPSAPEGLLTIGSDEGFGVRSGDLALLSSTPDCSASRCRDSTAADGRPRALTAKPGAPLP